MASRCPSGHIACPLGHEIQRVFLLCLAGAEDLRRWRRPKLKEPVPGLRSCFVQSPGVSDEEREGPQSSRPESPWVALGH